MTGLENLYLFVKVYVNLFNEKYELGAGCMRYTSTRLSILYVHTALTTKSFQKFPFYVYNHVSMEFIPSTHRYDDVSLGKI